MDEVPYGSLDLMILKTLDGARAAAWLRHRETDRAGG